MKKYLQSGWMRVVSQIICVISILCMVIGIVGFVFVTEFDDVDGIYEEGYRDIAENYSMYAIDMVQQGKEAELKSFLDNNKISVNVKYISNVVQENGELAPVEETIFSTGNVPFNNNVAGLAMVAGSNFQYAKNSLLAMLYGYRYYYDEGEWVEYPIQHVIYDPGLGLFLYQTEVGYFKVPDIQVYVDDGTYIDYALVEKNGVESYYNGYYNVTLDPLSCQDWNAVVVGNVYMELVPYSAEEFREGRILVVPDNWIPVEDIKTSDYTFGDEVVYTISPENSEYYVVELDWVPAYGLSNCFSEWLEVCDMLTVFEKMIIPLIIVGIVLFIISFAMLIYSANNKKESLSFMCRVPVGFYTASIAFVEFLLSGLVVFCVQCFIMQDKGKFASSVIILSILSVIIVWIFVAWFQNIVTRIKCRSFWRTSEVYYIYKFIKDSWGYIIKPIKWCWRIVTTPFKAIGNGCKKALHIMGQNVPLFWGGIAVFAVLTFLNFILAINAWWHEGLFMVFYWVLLLGEGVVFVWILYQVQQLHEGSKRIASGDLSNPVDTSKMFWKFKEHGENINKVSDGIQLAVNERMKSEHFKTELITNVSHDIKTPLTSIINYVDLIKKEEIQDEKVQGYIEVLDRQSARLKKLIEDLMEASKASTGNLTVNLEECDIEVLLTQVIGEFEERLQKNQLEVVVDKPDHPVKMMADGRHMWRVLDNLLNNACKYSLPGSRVYVSLQQNANEAVIVFKNISKTALNIPSEELMERFVRGDSSRNTEGSGLGLSIAQSLTELMQGNMKLEIDGDLFKVTLRFPMLGNK